MKILLIIPAYNEQENILKTCNEIFSYNKKNGTSYDLIVINDGSSDSTESILKENKIPHIRLVNNLGIGGAVQTGYKYAYENDYDISVQYDGDGQHHVEYVKNIVDPIINDEYDCVIGSRFIKKDDDNFKSTLLRRVGINIISFFITLFTGKRIFDCTSGFRATSKDIIKEFAFNYPTEYPEPISEVTLLKKKKKIKEVPVKMRERTGGVSSIHAGKTIYYMVNVILSIFIVSIRMYK